MIKNFMVYSINVHYLEFRVIKNVVATFTLIFLYLAMWYIFRIKSIEVFAQQCFCCVSVQVEMPKHGQNR